MPRKPLTFYVKEKMAAISGTKDVQVIRQTLGNAAKEFGQLSAEQQKPYLDMAEADKKRYEQEFAQWRAKNPASPSRPLSAYVRYFNATRAQAASENPGKSVIDLARIVADRWKSLSEAERKPYEDAAAKDFDQFKKDYAAWKKKVGKD